MKNYLLLFSIGLLLLMGCKSRKEASSHRDSTSLKKLTTQTASVSNGVDTSKSTKAKVVQKTEAIILKDSTGTKTTITPVPGTTSTVDVNGTFHGQAQSIETTRHRKREKQTKINSNKQELFNEAKGIDTTKKSFKSTTNTDSTATHKGNTTVDIHPVKSNWFAYVEYVCYAIGLVGLYFVGNYVYKMIKPG